MNSEETKEEVEVEALKAGFDYTANTAKTDNTLEQEVEEVARKVVAEVDTKNQAEAVADTDSSPEEEVEERNQDADNTKIHHNPNSANTDFPSIETAAVAEDSDSAAGVAAEQNSTEMVEGMAYTKP